VFIVPEATRYWLFVLMLVYGSLMVGSFLAFGATNEFKITCLGIGPTETRLLFIILNTIIIFGGTGTLIRGIPWFTVALSVMMVFISCRTQKYIWNIAMKARRERSSS
jgi:hypothetical protein